MSYTVARRTREIAIRVAFGAVSSRVTVLIVSDMLALVVAGMVLALPAFWWLNQYVSSQLYGVSPTDATSVLSAAALLLLAAVIAVWVPSRRALRVNPMVALRDEQTRLTLRRRLSAPGRFNQGHANGSGTAVLLHAARQLHGPALPWCRRDYQLHELRRRRVYGPVHSGSNGSDG
jgi:hypothetical protein